MKIFFIGECSEREKQSAPLLVAAGLFNAFRQKNIPVKYITYFTDGSKYSVFQKIFGRQVIDKDTIRFGIIPMIIYVVRNKPDVLYLLNIEFFYFPLLLMKFVLKYKIYYTSHGIVAYENRYFRKIPFILNMKNLIIEYLNFKISDKIISLSKKSARLISYCYNLDRGKIRVLDNGLSSIGTFNKKTSAFNPLSVKLAVVGSTSRKEKGIGFLIKALSLLDYKIELNVYGENTDLLRTDRFNNLNVNLHPFVENKELICKLADNDIFIAPSSYDTFNLSLLEAMNIGMLIISSDRVGLAERFDDKLMKFVYKHNNMSDLQDKLKMVINFSPEERSFYSELNHEFSLAFNWDKVSNQYLTIFNE